MSSISQVQGIFYNAGDSLKENHVKGFSTLVDKALSSVSEGENIRTVKISIQGAPFQKVDRTTSASYWDWTFNAERTVKDLSTLDVKEFFSGRWNEFCKDFCTESRSSMKIENGPLVFVELKIQLEIFTMDREGQICVSTTPTSMKIMADPTHAESKKEVFSMATSMNLIKSLESASKDVIEKKEKSEGQGKSSQFRYSKEEMAMRITAQMTAAFNKKK